MNIVKNTRTVSTIIAVLLAWSFSTMPALSQEFKMPPLPPLPVDSTAFRTEEIHFESAGKDLFGMRFTPVGKSASLTAGKKGKMPAVIMSHGFNGDPVLFYELIDTLVRRGYICYFFDFSGGSMRTRSEGEFLDMTVLTEKQNLHDAILFVRGWKDVDRSNLFLVGESQGGLVSALTAAAEPGKIKAMALMYPAFVIPDDARKAFASKADIPDVTEFLGTKVGGSYFRAVYDMDVYKIIPRFKKDVLIVHGDKDQLVPIEYSRKALWVYPSAKMKVNSGAGHGFFMPEHSHRNVAWISEFFAEEIGK